MLPSLSFRAVIWRMSEKHHYKVSALWSEKLVHRESSTSVDHDKELEHERKRRYKRTTREKYDVY